MNNLCLFNNIRTKSHISSYWDVSKTSYWIFIILISKSPISRFDFLLSLWGRCQAFFLISSSYFLLYFYCISLSFPLPCSRSQDVVRQLIQRRRPNRIYYVLVRWGFLFLVFFHRATKQNLLDLDEVMYQRFYGGNYVQHTMQKLLDLRSEFMGLILQFG